MTRDADSASPWGRYDPDDPARAPPGLMIERRKRWVITVRCHGCGRSADQDVVQREWLTEVFIPRGLDEDGDETVEQVALCPRCARWHVRFWLKGWRIGRISHWLEPGPWSACRRCRTSWRFVKGHVTMTSAGSGCFPLCEACWAELSPKERLPYYRSLFEQWQRQGSTNHTWTQIESAVLEEVGGEYEHEKLRLERGSLHGPDPSGL